MQDIELMHMRYALESAIFALGSMEKCIAAGPGENEMTMGYLRDLKSHMDAIHNNTRKVCLTLNSLKYLNLIDFCLCSKLM